MTSGGTRTTNSSPPYDRGTERSSIKAISGDPDPSAMTLQALERRLRSAELSARLHAVRATNFETALRQQQAAISVIRRSTSWRLTSPIRFAVRLLRQGPQQAGRGITVMLLHMWRQLKSRKTRKQTSRFEQTVRLAYTAPARTACASVVAPRFLIIAELSLAQCAKYRVWQRQEALQRLGTACTVLDWQRDGECRSALQTHAAVIFYRVPGFPQALALIEEARRLGVTTYWEVDDLIFDRASYLKNRNLDLIDPQLRAGVLAGVELFRAALLASERGIASTPALAQAMRDTGKTDVMLIENALDDETLELARQSRRPLPDSGDCDAAVEKLVIGYGSGSKAHNADFLEVAGALAVLLREHPEIELQIMGDLTLPDELEAFAARIKTFAASSYARYFRWLAGCDISLAPLENTVFNDAKSNIKYIEASILGVPSVCSPRQAFRDAIDGGVDGILADTTGEWLAGLEALAKSARLRRQMSAAAHAKVLARYAPDVVGAQVKKLVDGLDRRRRKKFRLLAVNVFFWPQSYGGATIVAQELARRLHGQADFEVGVFTTNPLADAQPYVLTRYADFDHADGMPIFAVGLPDQLADPVAVFDNPQMMKCFEDVLAAYQPDIVHFHCLQGISSSVLEVCQTRNVPFVVTVHDAWWLCQRQFMVTGEGRYCAQTRIDVRVCEACIPGALHLRDRMEMSLQRLSGAARLLFPSAFHRDLHLANGVDPARSLVNRNGVRAPDRARPLREAGVLRFGYVGGNDRVKGIHLVRDAFETIGRNDYRLVLVDNTQNAGYSTMRVDEWRLSGEVAIVPGYRQDGLDAFFETLDVLLFPSQWKESFGLTVREALIRDVWVIATDGGGTVEDIVDGVNGTILPFETTAEDLRMALVALLDRPDRLAEHRNPLKQQIVTHQMQAEELAGMLREVVAASQ